jgi:hypothetical protein
MIECKSHNRTIIKPSTVRRNDLFVSVELCAESIQEDTFLQTNESFRSTWIAFMGLLEQIKAAGAPDKFFETGFFLLYLAAIIFKRYITYDVVQEVPEIFSIEGYAALGERFRYSLFESVESASDQMKYLAESLRNLK